MGMFLFVVGVANIYESLYQTGYHKDLTLSHAREVIKRIKNAKSVLDVGCSHGYAVAALWKQGVQANGIDIAPSAIALATRARGQGLCGEDPCFQTGNATNLPFDNKHFDTLISTDVFEHLAPHDVDAAIRETLRVTRKDMWLKIATIKELNRQPLANLHRMDKYKAVANLHTAVMNLTAWAHCFRQSGAKDVHIVGNLVYVIVQ